jgi:hypothetical protein
MTSHLCKTDEVERRTADRQPGGDTVCRRFVGLLFGAVLMASCLPTGTITWYDIKRFRAE